MMLARLKLRYGLLLAVMLSGCGYDASAGGARGNHWRTTKADMVVAVKRDLRPGSPSSEIETFYKRHDISYTFDPVGNARYEAIIRDVCCFLDHAIRVDIDVDLDGRFVKSRIEDSYTFL